MRRGRKTTRGNSSFVPRNRHFGFTSKNKVNEDISLWVGGLPLEMDEDQLEDIFREYGTIYNVRLMRDNETMESRRFGFVTFFNKQQGEKAIKALRYKVFDNCVMQVNWKSKYPKELEDGTRVHIKGLPEHATEKELHDLMERFGEVINVVAMRNKDGASLQCANVLFRRRYQAENCLRMNRKIKIYNHLLELISFEDSNNKKQKSSIQDKSVSMAKVTNPKNNLIVKSIRKDVTESDFEAVFRKFGSVKSVSLKKHTFKHNMEVVQQGFISFETEEEARQAILKAEIDPEVLNLLCPSHEYGKQFIFIHQSQAQRKIEKMANKFPMKYPLTKKIELSHSPSFSTSIVPPKVQILEEEQFENDSKSLSGEESLTELRLIRENPESLGADKVKKILSTIASNRVRNLYPYSDVDSIVEVLVDLDSLDAEDILDTIEDDDLLREMVEEAESIISENGLSKHLINKYDLSWVNKNLQEFKELNLNIQKSILGKLIYAKVKILSRSNATTITQMLIEVYIEEDTEEIIKILQDDRLLEEKILECIEIIEEEVEQK